MRTANRQGVTIPSQVGSEYFGALSFLTIANSGAMCAILATRFGVCSSAKCSWQRTHARSHH